MEQERKPSTQEPKPKKKNRVLNVVKKVAEYSVIVAKTVWDIITIFKRK